MFKPRLPPRDNCKVACCLMIATSSARRQQASSSITLTSSLLTASVNVTLHLPRERLHLLFHLRFSFPAGGRYAAGGRGTKVKVVIWDDRPILTDEPVVPAALSPWEECSAIGILAATSIRRLHLNLLGATVTGVHVITTCVHHTLYPREMTTGSIHVHYIHPLCCMLCLVCVKGQDSCQNSPWSL